LGWLTRITDSGSPELAEEWRAELAPLSSPEEAVQKNPRIQVRHFDDGSWVFGLCQDSHRGNQRGAGTLVVKDSRGEVRAFFGHVCGWLYLELGAPKAPDLDEFYRRLPMHRFVEYKFRGAADKPAPAHRPRG
jgi:hypothetical protein